MIYLLLFFGSVIFSLAATPVLIARARAWGLMDSPDERKTHPVPMPLAGGLVLFPLILAAYLIAFLKDQRLSFLIAATATIFVLGVADDLKGVHFSTKFFVQIIAALLVIQSGALFDLNRINILDGLGIHFGWIVSIAGTLVWIVGITNAVNLIDGMDGLASGLCLNASVGIGAVALMTYRPDLALVCVIMAGGLLGFLRYNVHPARTYLGDSGSMLLGFTLAVLSIFQSAKTSAFLVLIVPALLLAIPMTDTALVFLRRTTRGANPFKPDRRHLHHKLLDLNFSVRQTLGIFYSLSAALGLLALWLLKSNNAQIIALALVFLIAVIIAVKAMQVFNFHNLIKKVNRRIRAIARKAVGRERSDEERLGRNLTLLLSLSILNLMLVIRDVPFSGVIITAIAGLFVLGAADFMLNSREAEPRYEILHIVIFLSIVLNQVIVLALLPSDHVQSKMLLVFSFTTLAGVGLFLMRTGAFAAFLQDPVEILGLFIALVVIELVRHFMDVSSSQPFAAAMFNALVLYTLSKVYLTGYRIRTGFVTAGLAVFVIVLVGMTWF